MPPKVGDRFNPSNLWGVMIPGAVLSDKTLSPGAKVCFAVLIDLGDEYREEPVDQSHATIAKVMGTNVRQVVRFMDELEKDGWIKTIRKAGQMNEYSFIWKDAFGAMEAW